MKPIKYKEKIMSAFNFQYAGVVNVFISFSRKKYIVITKGCKIQERLCFFDSNEFMRSSFNSLYDAISEFNHIIQIVTESMDWFTPTFFFDDFDKQFSKDVYT